MRTLNRLISLVLTTAISLTSAADTGQDIYKKNCASCHGDKFQGSGLGPELSPGNYRYGGSHNDFQRIIKNGMPSLGMPSFSKTLSADEIIAVANFLPVRQLNNSNARSSKPPKDSLEIETLDYVARLEVLAEGLDIPWGLEFLDSDTLLISERIGRLQIFKNGKLKRVEGTPDDLIRSPKKTQGGYLDVALDPNYAQNGWIYLCYSQAAEPVSFLQKSRGMVRLVRGKIKNHTWTDQQTLFEVSHDLYTNKAWHYGGRITFDQNGLLYFSVGDRGEREQARELAKPFGKIHRLTTEGKIPKDNPYRKNKNAMPSIFSIGHRNPQGITTNPFTGQLWAVEHGPRGGDELNSLRPGKDYGWPVASYGINYNGTLLTPHTRLKGTEQPIYYWRPSIAVSGLTFYKGEEFPQWQEKLIVAGLKTRDLRLLTMDGERVLHEEVILKTEGRPYEPVVGPDGAIYIVTDSPGQLLRLSALKERKI